MAASHAKVLTLFERIMAGDNALNHELYRPDATKLKWFGAGAGKLERPAGHGRRASGDRTDRCACFM